LEIRPADKELEAFILRSSRISCFWPP